MRDPFAVSFIQSISHLNADLCDFGWIHRAPLDLLGQRLPFYILHRNEVDPIRFSNFVDRRNIRVLESGSRLRLPNKASHSVWIGSERRWQDLQSDGAIKPPVLS